MNLKNQNGSAAIELAAIAPLIAALVIIIVQFAAFFHNQMDAIAKAEAEAKKIVAEWDANQNGFDRPCLEKLPKHLITAGGEMMPIGIGAWEKKIGVPEEVAIVWKPICTAW